MAEYYRDHRRAAEVPRAASPGCHTLCRAAPGRAARHARRAVARSRVGSDPARVGFLGFSAGGHLTAAVSTNFNVETYPPGDAADKLTPARISP